MITLFHKRFSAFQNGLRSEKCEVSSSNTTYNVFSCLDRHQLFGIPLSIYINFCLTAAQCTWQLVCWPVWNNTPVKWLMAADRRASFTYNIFQVRFIIGNEISVYIFYYFSTEMVQLMDTLPQSKIIYLVLLIPSLLMPWWRKVPGHHMPYS